MLVPERISPPEASGAPDNRLPVCELWMLPFRASCPPPALPTKPEVHGRRVVCMSAPTMMSTAQSGEKKT